MKPEVSIVIGAYNCADFIQKTVNSVINQSLTDWELIIVDDCSTDDTHNKIKELNDERIRIIYLPKNSGLPAVSRNNGIREAKGNFIAFLDHDDLWSEDKLAIQVNFLKENPETALVSCFLGIDSPEPRYNNSCVGGRDRVKTGFLYDRLLNSNFIACSSVMVRQSVLEKTGNFDEDPRIIAAEDWDLWLRIAMSHKISFIPQILGTYRMRASGLSRRSKCLESISNVINKHLSRGWVDKRRAYAALTNFYLHEAWFLVDKDAKLARKFFNKSLRSSVAKVFLASALGLIMSYFPAMCRFIKSDSLDKKIIRFTRLQSVQKC